MLHHAKMSNDSEIRALAFHVIRLIGSLGAKTVMEYMFEVALLALGDVHKKVREEAGSLLEFFEDSAQCPVTSATFAALCQVIGADKTEWVASKMADEKYKELYTKDNFKIAAQRLWHDDPAVRIAAVTLVNTFITLHHDVFYSSAMHSFISVVMDIEKRLHPDVSVVREELERLVAYLVPAGQVQSHGADKQFLDAILASAPMPGVHFIIQADQSLFTAANLTAVLKALNAQDGDIVRASIERLCEVLQSNADLASDGMRRPLEKLKEESNDQEICSKIDEALLLIDKADFEAFDSRAEEIQRGIENDPANFAKQEILDEALDILLTARIRCTTYIECQSYLILNLMQLVIVDTMLFNYDK